MLFDDSEIVAIVDCCCTHLFVGVRVSKCDNSNLVGSVDGGCTYLFVLVRVAKVMIFRWFLLLIVVARICLGW